MLVQTVKDFYIQESDDSLQRRDGGRGLRNILDSICLLLCPIIGVRAVGGAVWWRSILSLDLAE
jgi:hypothetical protein